jgi:hypothetical protein
VIDAIKEFLQVDIDHDLATGLDEALRRKDCVVGSPSRSKAVAVLAECLVQPRLQHLQQGLLD